MKVLSYRTIQRPSEGNYKEKGSKFLGFAVPVRSEYDVKQKLSEVKKKYFDARHHCYAFVLGPDKMKYRAFDDGEPNHSAGDPILGQIRSRDLTNVLIVVVRYFGGVKLGVGGLISAYKAAAENALDNSTIIEQEVLQQYEIKYTYVNTPDVIKLVKEFELQIIDQRFDEECVLVALITLRLEEKFLEKVKLLKALGGAISVLEIPLS